MATDMPDYRDGFHDMIDDRTVEDFQLEDEARFEDAIVGWLLNRYCSGNSVKYEMLQEYADEHGVKRLTLEAFHDRFPQYPLRLFARKFPKIVAACPVHRFFEKFDKTVICKAFDELSDLYDPDAYSNYGMAFFWPHLRQIKTQAGGVLVLHTLEEDPPDVPGTRIVLRLEESPGSPRELHLEPLWRLAEIIDRSFTWD